MIEIQRIAWPEQSLHEMQKSALDKAITAIEGKQAGTPLPSSSSAGFT